MPWMRMFIGREAVLRKLNHMYESEKYQMLVLYGRRRIGETTLLNEFCKDKNPICKRTGRTRRI